jgi:hypothetical protein
MYIKSLEQMENIVKNNRSLFWSGWDVMHKTKTDKGRTSKNGKFINGKWYIVNKIKLNRDGWYIPEKLT